MDFLSAFSAVGATLNNLGPGLGEVANNFKSLTDISKIALCLSMLLKVEIFTLLLLLLLHFGEINQKMAFLIKAFIKFLQYIPYSLP